ncbi:MAG: hypothetical protein DRI90_15525 [Deltaproteobacteria bacterium]|nr:MAG: hypothetical protein DRI90_15525 [Deltaproteobacteria bacterium]
MDRGRIKLVSRGEPVVMAYRDLLLPDELKYVLPETEARAELEWLTPDSVRRVVDSFGARFPNSREPENTKRVMTYVAGRVAAGSLALVKKV